MAIIRQGSKHNSFGTEPLAIQKLSPYTIKVLFYPSIHRDKGTIEQRDRHLT